jgi:hypothetical protein
VEAQHAEPGRLAHAPHLAVAALVQLELNHAFARRLVAHAHPRRGAAHAGLELDPLLQPSQHLR